MNLAHAELLVRFVAKKKPDAWLKDLGDFFRWAEANPSEAIEVLRKIPRQELHPTAAALRAYSSDHYHRIGWHEHAFLLSNLAALIQIAAESPITAIEYWLACIADPLRLSQNGRILRVASLLRSALEQFDAPLDLWGAFFERMGTICASYDDVESARVFGDAASIAFRAYESDYAGTSLAAAAQLHAALGRRLGIWCDTRLTNQNAIEPMKLLIDEMDDRAQNHPRDSNTGTWRAIAGNTRVMLVDTYIRLSQHDKGNRRLIDRAQALLGERELTGENGSNYSQYKAGFDHGVMLARTGQVDRGREIFRESFKAFQQRGLYLSFKLDDYLHQYQLLGDDVIKEHGEFRVRSPLFTDKDIVKRLASLPPRLVRSALSMKPVEKSSVQVGSPLRQNGIAMIRQPTTLREARSKRKIVDYKTPTSSDCVELTERGLRKFLRKSRFTFVLDMEQRLLFDASGDPEIAKSLYYSGIDAVVFFNLIFDSLDNGKYDRWSLRWGTEDAERSRVKRLKEWLNTNLAGLGDILVLRPIKGVAQIPGGWSGCRIRSSSKLK